LLAAKVVIFFAATIPVTKFTRSAITRTVTTVALLLDELDPVGEFSLFILLGDKLTHHVINGLILALVILPLALVRILTAAL